MLGTRLTIGVILFLIARGPFIAHGQLSRSADSAAPALQQNHQPTSGNTRNCNEGDTGTVDSDAAANCRANCYRRDCGAVTNVAIEPQTAEKPDPSARLTFLTALSNWLFNWPFLILIILAFFTAWPNRLKLLLSPFESLKLFGAEFILNRAGGEEVEDRLARLRKREKEEFDQAITAKNISSKHRRLVDEYIKPRIQQFAFKDVRSTIHVQDLLFRDGLYQLLDYYPAQASGAGRAFSSRRGIIGKAWRLGKSLYDPVVPTGEDTLIVNWGMTRFEASRAGHDRHSFACVVLKLGTDPLGLFYFDSPVERAFGEDDSSSAWLSLETAITKGAIDTGLISDLLALNRDLIRPSAEIGIFSEE